jgi:hypothetical protein
MIQLATAATIIIKIIMIVLVIMIALAIIIAIMIALVIMIILASMIALVTYIIIIVIIVIIVGAVIVGAVIVGAVIIIVISAMTNTMDIPTIIVIIKVIMITIDHIMDIQDDYHTDMNMLRLHHNIFGIDTGLILLFIIVNKQPYNLSLPNRILEIKYKLCQQLCQLMLNMTRWL